jgi:hypothetical protein
MTSKLIQWCFENGYEVTWGDAYRDSRLFGAFGSRYPDWVLSVVSKLIPDLAKKILSNFYGSIKSFHKIRLAIDLNLFKNGKLLSKSEDYKPIAAYWKSLHPDNTWGGDFKNKDGNHYSFGERRI